MDLVPVPAVGRVAHGGRRRVRLGDASPGGRLRFDALVRYLQDVANDDTREAGFDDVMGWVVRRTAIEVHRFPCTSSRWSWRRGAVARVVVGPSAVCR